MLFSRSSLLLALPFLVAAQNSTQEMEGAFLDPQVESCTLGPAASCASYKQFAETCYAFSADDLGAGITCICTSEAQASIAQCAECVRGQVGDKSPNFELMKGYAEEMVSSCNDWTTALSSSMSSASSASSSASISSASSTTSTPTATGTAGTPASPAPTGAGSTVVVSAFGAVGALGSAMLLLV